MYPDKMPSSVIPTRADVVTEARGWIGTRWRHQGRTRLGIDCVGLIVRVAHALNLSTFDCRDYDRRPDGRALLEHFDREMCRKSPGDAAPGDVMLFVERSAPCHTAIVAERRGAPSIIHAFARRRQVVEEPLAHEWPSKIIGCYRFQGLA